MSDRQVFAAIIGGIVFVLLGGLSLIGLIQLLVYVSGGHIDGADDGWGLLWILLTIICGVVGAILSAKWARRRYGDFRA